MYIPNCHYNADIDATLVADHSDTLIRAGFPVASPRTRGYRDILVGEVAMVSAVAKGKRI
jgi:hypothetical protein